MVCVSKTTRQIPFTSGAAAIVVFSAQPGGAVGGKAFDNLPQLTVTDVGGNPAVNYGGSVTLSIFPSATTGTRANAPAGSLSGTRSTSFVSGKASLAGGG